MSDRNPIPDPETLLRHGASVRAIATAILGDPSAADDVAQETFLAALRGGAAPVRDTGAWLRGVTRNLARRWIRTESRRRHREEARPLPADAATPEETAARLETETALTDAVRALREPYRTVVVLRYFDGLTTAATAARTGAPEATVKTRLRRALAMLRDALDRRYGARGIWVPLLVRISRPEAPAAATAAVGSATLAAGGFIMAKKILIATVFAAVMAAVFVAPMLWDASDPGPAPDGAPDTPTVVAGESVPPSEPEGSSDAASGGTAAATGPRADAFRVIVHYADGSPANEARVELLGTDERPAGEAKTNADGAAELVATGGPGTVRISAPGAAQETHEVEARAGTETVVTLALGSVISGTFYLGDNPAPGIDLHLNALDQSIAQLSVMTDARGGFRFSGLAAGTRYYLFAGWNVSFVDPEGEHNVHLDAPSTGLAIRAQRHPCIRGTVIRSDGSPAGGAVVRVSYRAGEGGGGRSRVSAGEDGRFEAYARAGTPLESITIDVADTDTASREKLEVDPARLREGVLDVGRIVLRPSRTFEFVVRGVNGKPVPGAIAITAEDRPRTSPPTDAAGNTRLEVAAGATSVVVGAPGEGVADVRLPAEAAGPIPVTLPGGTLLTVRLRTKEGKVPAYLRLVLEADTRLLDVPEDRVAPMYGGAGMASPHAYSVTDTWSQLEYSVPVSGTLRLAGIRAGVPFRVRIHDALTDREVGVRDLRLGTRERRDVDIALSIPEKNLVVQVKDPEGRPLPRAYLEVDVGGGVVRATTNALGIAAIPSLRGETVRIEITKAGRVPYVGSYPLETLPEVVPVVMSPGRSVRLRVTDGSGTPVACEWTEARAPDLDYRFQGNDLDDGLYLFADLPAGKVTLMATYAGVRHEVVAGAKDTEAAITVPATGSVVVRFEGKLDEPVRHQVRLTPTSGSSGRLLIHDIGYNPAVERWEVRIPAVMPGRYRVTLEHWADRDGKGATQYETCRTGGVVKVAEGKESETRLPR